MRRLVLALVAFVSSVALAAEWPDLGKPLQQSPGGGEKDAAVIIGIENYVALPAVPGAVKNATDWYLYLANVLKVPPANLTLLRNQEASLEKLKKYVAQAAAQVKPGGRLWFIFIGHGAPAKDGQDGVLVGFDAQQDADSLYARSIGQRELLGLAKGPKILAVVDACFSGRGAAGPLVPGLQPVIALRPLAATPTGPVVLSAGKSDQFAGPLPGASRPAFSYLVLGALRGWGDTNHDGTVDSREAIDFATLTLQATVKDRTQTPELVGQPVVLAASGGEKGPDLASLVVERAPSAPPTAPSTTTPPTAAPQRAPSGKSGPESALTTIAVAELKGRVPPELQWLGGSIADAVLVRLQKARQVRVVEREFLDQVATELKLQSSAMVDQGSAVQMGRLLGARIFVFGSVAVVDGEVVVRARLVNVERGETIGEPIEVSGAQTRLAALQTAVAKEVVKALTVELALADGTGLESTEIAFEAYADLDKLRLAARGLPLLGGDPARRRRTIEWQNAMALVTRLEAAYPRLAIAPMYGALFSLQLDDVEGAAAQAELARRLAPNDLETLLVAINVFNQRGQTDEAWRLAVEATTRFPDDARGWFLLAKLQLASRDNKSAIISLLGALERSPRVSAAETTLRTLVAGPEGAALIAQLAAVPRARAAAATYRAFWVANVGAAQADALETARTSPALHVGHLVLGMLERRAGAFARAEQLLLLALSLRPDAPEVHRELAEVMVDQRRCSDAAFHAQWYVRKALAVTDAEPLNRRLEGCRTP